MAHKSHHRKQRVENATNNASYRAQRTNEQQLALIAARPGNSKKETARLENS